MEVTGIEVVGPLPADLQSPDLLYMVGSPVQPKNDQRGAENGRPEHCPQGNKRLIPPRWKPGDQLLDEIQLDYHLGEVLAGLGGLPKGEALGIEVIGHVDCIAQGIP
jgi:hypothetical protein